MAVMASFSVVQRVSRDGILCQMNVSKNPEWTADGHQRSLVTKLQVDRRSAAVAGRHLNRSTMLSDGLVCFANYTEQPFNKEGNSTA